LNKVSSQEVLKVLGDFGLQTKPAETLCGGGVLGLRVFKEKGVIKWKRDNTLQELSDEMTKRQVLSWCGQAIGHFPIAGWLRPACSIVKRMVDEQIDKTSAGMLMDIKKRLDVCDPVGGV